MDFIFSTNPPGRGQRYVFVPFSSLARLMLRTFNIVKNKKKEMESKKEKGRKGKRNERGREGKNKRERERKERKPSTQTSPQIFKV